MHTVIDLLKLHQNCINYPAQAVENYDPAYAWAIFLIFDWHLTFSVQITAGKFSGSDAPIKTLIPKKKLNQNIAVCVQMTVPMPVSTEFNSVPIAQPLI